MQAKASRFITYNVSCNVDDQVEVVYRCPPNTTAKMSLIYISNADGNTDLSLMWYRVRYLEEFQIIKARNFTAGDVYQISGAMIVLEPGDELRATASATAPDLDILCTVEEIFKPVG